MCIYAHSQSMPMLSEVYASVFNSSDSSAITKVESKKTVSKVESLINLAQSYLGTPYRYGGTSDKGFDCSGFINTVFEWLDIKLPRSSREIAQMGYTVAWNELMPGDFVFFSRSSKSHSIGHIGMIVEVGDNMIKMIHSSTSKGVVEENIVNMPYYRNRFVTAKRFDLF
jgi:cell wall-associated NlpC family hydrolase